MCALVAGAAFADTTFGGQIFVKGELLKGDNVNDEHPKTGALGLDAYNTLVKITFGDATAGGWLGIHNGNGAWYHGFAWWRPIPQVKIQLGRNQDGDFGNAQISGWGFTGEAKNIVALPEYQSSFILGQGRDHSRTTGWYPGISGWALELSVFPIEGLSVNLSLPLSEQMAAATFSKFELNVQYRLVDIGTATLSFQSNTGYKEGDDDKWYGGAGIVDPAASPKIFASFYLTAIENMGVDIGLAYKFPFKNTVTETTTNHPFEIGLGFRYAINSDFNVKLRAGFSLGGSTVVGDADPVKDPLQISVSILPNYKIGTATVYLFAGLGIQAVEDWEETGVAPIFKESGSNAVVSWFINPYVLIPAGGIRFMVGFQVSSDGVGYSYWDKGAQFFDKPKINWAIPIGFYCYF
jgi:hypothetical protein